MTPKTDLHQLIHSLTGSEKRFFTLFAKRHIIGDENKYLLLYNAIEKQKEYDELELKRALNYRKDYANLAAEKVYLKELILKSLKHFHEKNFIDSVLYDKLIQIEILYEKGLYKLGYELVLKAIDISGKHEKYLINTQLLIWKINYDIKLSYFRSGTDDSLKSAKNLALFLEFLNYKKTFHELFYITTHSDKSAKEKKVSEAIEKLKSAKGTGLPGSLLGLYYYYTSLSFISVLENNSKKAAQYFKKALQIFKDNYLFCKENANLYLVSANNYIYSLIISNELSAAENEVHILEETAGNLRLTIQQKARVATNIFDSRLLILAKQNKWKAAQEVAVAAEKEWHLFEKYIDTPRKIYIYFSFVNVHFFAGNHKLADKFLNRIIYPSAKQESEPSLLALAFIVQLAIMIRTKELLLFNNKLTAVRKYIKLHSLNEDLLIICDFISLSAKANAKTKIQRSELKAEIIEKCKKNKELETLCGYFDLVKWIENY